MGGGGVNARNRPPVPAPARNRGCAPCAPAREETTPLPHVAARPAVVGIRDLVFGLTLLALAVAASPRGVAVVLGVTIPVPLGDLRLRPVVRGGEVWTGHLLPHLASAGTLAAVALTVRRRADL